MSKLSEIDDSLPFALEKKNFEEMYFSLYATLWKTNAMILSKYLENVLNILEKQHIFTI